MKQRILELNGVQKSIADWAKELGISSSALAKRIDKYGWAVEKALSVGKIVPQREKLEGRKFSRLTVVEYAYTNKCRRPVYLCECECGNRKEIDSQSLKNGDIKSCGCLHASFEDLTGQVFGRLTVESYSHTTKKGETYWVCRCDCGKENIVARGNLKQGNVRSCGCMSNKKELVGEKFGQLLVQKQVGTDRHGVQKWRCLCDCGKKHVTTTNHLTTGQCKSCGCFHEDLMGRKFFYLTVIENAGVIDQKQNWKCRCKCGKEKIIRANSLLIGNTKSCGCLLSSMEEKIAGYLGSQGYVFNRQKTFADCKDKACLKFDFEVNNRLIEYNGPHHYKPVYGEKAFEAGKRRDEIKRRYCNQNDIPLLEIPYTTRWKDLISQIDDFLTN